MDLCSDWLLADFLIEKFYEKMLREITRNIFERLGGDEMPNPDRTRFGIDFDYFDISKTILDKILFYHSMLSSSFFILSPIRHQKLMSTKSISSSK